VSKEKIARFGILVDSVRISSTMVETMSAKLLSIAVLAASIASPLTAHAQDHITFAIGGLSHHGYLPLTIAQRKGFFREEGVEVEFDNFQGGTKAIEALVGGSADMAAGAYEYPLLLQPKGVEIATIAVLSIGHANIIGLRKELATKYKSPKDLKGKKIGVTAPGSASADWVASFLAKDGLTLNDVSIIGVGGGSTAVTMIESGRIDAMSAGEPLATRLVSSGDVVPIVDARTPEGMKYLFGGEIEGSAVFTTPAVMKKKGKTVQEFVTGVVHALRWMRSASAAEIAAVVPQEFYMNNRKLYEQVLAQNSQGYSPDAMVRPDAAENNLRFLISLHRRGPATPRDVERSYNNSFAENAMKKLTGKH
jgi:NitT/TauT family transport system substrate-binding protein